MCRFIPNAFPRSINDRIARRESGGRSLLRNGKCLVVGNAGSGMERTVCIYCVARRVVSAGEHGVSRGLRVVRKGHTVPENMRREFVTHEQLMSILREHGVEKVSDVKAAHIEGSGHTTVIKTSQEEQGDDNSTESHIPV